MCGIAGILKIYEPGEDVPHHLESIPEAWLDTLDESIKHRGPDGQGRFRDRAMREDGSTVDVAFVHRRLSIIDHEGGHQPMVHDGQRLRPDLTYQPGEEPILAHEACPDEPLVAVVFNGCIYNHRELRAELETQGYVFESDHSDTEVLVHGWRVWKSDWKHPALTRYLNGMYAAVLWDREQGITTGRRDPFGEKPLQTFYGLDPKTRVYCSNRTAFERLSVGVFEDADGHAVMPRPTASVSTWIRHGWNNQYGDYHYCRDVRPACDVPDSAEEPVHAGHFGAVSWLSQSTDSEPITAERIDELLRNSVSRRLESDVPLGCFLSGGIDSALIARFAKDDLSDLQTFTVRMPDPRLDESDDARATSVQLGTTHTTIDCQPEPASDLVSLVELLGQPFGDSSLLPTFWVSRAAREFIAVALAGDGGDELFCGYQRHQAPDLIRRLPPGLRLIPLSLFPDRNPRSNSSKFRRLLGVSRLPHTSWGAELSAIFPRRDLDRLVARPTSNWDMIDALKAIESRMLDPRGFDVVEYLTGDLLRKTDTASMAVGLEVRAPFLDTMLAEAVLRTPLDVLMPNGERKGLLKQVARRYLPDDIVDRPKRGFAIPVGEWFRTDFGGMRQLMLDHLRSSDPFPGLGEAGVEINMRFVEQMLKEHDAAGEKSINPWHGRDHSQRLYMLVVLSIWAKWLERTRREASA